MASRPDARTVHGRPRFLGLGDFGGDMCRWRFSTDTSPPPRVWLSRPPLGLTKDRSDSVSRPWRGIGLICGGRNMGGIMAADKNMFSWHYPEITSHTLIFRYTFFICTESFSLCYFVLVQLVIWNREFFQVLALHLGSSWYFYDAHHGGCACDWRMQEDKASVLWI